MGRTACTQPQCLYKVDLYLFTLLQECDKEKHVAVTVGFYCFLFERKVVKRFIQCHVLVVTPGRRPSDIRVYPVNTSHSPDLGRNIFLQCYL